MTDWLILVALAVVLFYLWKQRKAERLRRELAAARARAEAKPMVLFDEPEAPKEPLPELDDGVPGIFLKRHWPIGADHAPRSALGGLPRLDVGQDWPVNLETGFALHHLATIDLSEMPQGPGKDLPQTGLLSFFADINENMCWATGPGMPEARVIYSADPDAPFVPVPNSLPQIDHQDDGPTSRHWGFRPAPRHTYPRWPVTGHLVPTWDMEADWTLTEAISLRMTADREALTGKAPERTISLDPLLVRDGTDRTSSWHPEAFGPAFPWCLGVARIFHEEIDHLVKADLPRLEASAAKAAASGAEVPEHESEHAAALYPMRDWCARVQPLLEAGSDEDVPETTLTEAFNTFIARTAQGSYYAHNTIWNALGNTITRSGAAAVSDTGIRARIPREAFDIMAAHLHPGHENNAHYLLGAKAMAANPTEGRGIRLAQFDSDYGIGFQFCDVGIVDFWISAEDLAAQRWERAWAATAGG